MPGFSFDIEWQITHPGFDNKKLMKLLYLYFLKKYQSKHKFIDNLTTEGQRFLDSLVRLGLVRSYQGPTDSLQVQLDLERLETLAADPAALFRSRSASLLFESAI